jgi:hypothetical protein
MEQASVNNYASPVDTLLTYGEAKGDVPENWPNYLETGLGTEHIPDLIRMATDENLNLANSESLEVWAPIHALRTLGQLRAEAAVEPLLSLFKGNVEDIDWFMTEVPEVLGLIGPAALPTLEAYLADRAHREEARDAAIAGVEKLGNRWPEARSASVALLVKQLEQFAENEPEINSFIVTSLIALKASEALPSIERVFTDGNIDSSITGDWENVQVEFGVKSEEEAEQERSRRLPETPFHSLRDRMVSSSVATKERPQNEDVHKKSRNAMAKQSRKKNRKR